MYLMSALARPDVWPSGDYGVRMGWSLLHDLDEPIGAAELAAAADHLAPDRSTVAWYCWRAVDLRRENAG
jgi:DNA-3-methyladenine glycosylase II